MDTLTWMIIGTLAMIAIAATLYALNRSWGSFPKDARYQPRSGASAPGISPGARSPAESSAPWAERPGADQIAAPALDAPEPASWLVPIAHPMMRRAAEQALQRGDATARYIVRQAISWPSTSARSATQRSAGKPIPLCGASRMATISISARSSR